MSQIEPHSQHDRALFQFPRSEVERGMRIEKHGHMPVNTIFFDDHAVRTYRDNPALRLRNIGFDGISREFAAGIRNRDSRADIVANFESAGVVKDLSAPDVRIRLEMYYANPLVVFRGQRILADRNQMTAAYPNFGDMVRYQVDSIVLFGRRDYGSHYRATFGPAALQVDVIAGHKLLVAFEIHSPAPDLGAGRQLRGRDFVVELQGDGIVFDGDQRAAEALVRGHFRLSRETALQGEAYASGKQRSHVHNCTLKFKSRPTGKVQSLVEQHQVQLREAWHGYFRTRGR